MFLFYITFFVSLYKKEKNFFCEHLRERKNQTTLAAQQIENKNVIATFAVAEKQNQCSHKWYTYESQ